MSFKLNASKYPSEFLQFPVPVAVHSESFISFHPSLALIVSSIKGEPDFLHLPEPVAMQFLSEVVVVQLNFVPVNEVHYLSVPSVFMQFFVVRLVEHSASAWLVFAINSVAVTESNGLVFFLQALPVDKSTQVQSVILVHALALSPVVGVTAGSVFKWVSKASH